ncbi:MAG: molybdopterin-binding protein [Desulfurococcaceae archaeon]
MGSSNLARQLCFGVIVVSDRIAEGTGVDVSGEESLRELREKGLCVGGKRVVQNSYREILRAIREVNERVLVLIGGTGPSPRDITADVVSDIAWRCLPGFGELFRYLSYREVGARAAITRANLCILHDGKIVVALPGSKDGALLGVNLLVQVVDHLVEEVDRFEAPHRV